MDKTNIEYVLPEEIEMRSFEIIAAELAERGITLPAEQDMITRRVIHTSADFDYAETMTYSENAVEVHAFLAESGLAFSSHSIVGAWAMNEFDVCGKSG